MKGSVLPTLPSLPAIDGTEHERAALLAGLVFVESATSFSTRDLLEWFRTYAFVLGRTSPPAWVTESAVGMLALVPGAKLSGDKIARPDDLPKLLAMARWKVIVTLRGLLASPADDRFLQAAIFADRVRRVKGTWTARPRDIDVLSDVVLSLFAVDVLSHRAFHEQNLCVCDVCGRISYAPAVTGRKGCGEHVPSTEATSGIRGKRGE